jgi:YHS domain-containing protein
MTAQRQEIKGRWFKIAGVAVVAGFVAGALPVPVAATTERLVVDELTGLALGGMDPVAYFTDAQMLAGRPDLELTAQGAVWRFRNEGNLAFFRATPEAYVPQFGGYDPIDVARGVPVAGRPLVWLIHGQKLYLFAREESRAAFAADPKEVLHDASARWPTLRDTLGQN